MINSQSNCQNLLGYKNKQAVCLHARTTVKFHCCQLKNGKFHVCLFQYIYFILTDFIRHLNDNFKGGAEKDLFINWLL